MKESDITWKLMKLYVWRKNLIFTRSWQTSCYISIILCCFCTVIYQFLSYTYEDLYLFTSFPHLYIYVYSYNLCIWFAISHDIITTNVLFILNTLKYFWITYKKFTNMYLFKVVSMKRKKQKEKCLYLFNL